MGFCQVQHGIVLLGDFAHDGQAQTRAICTRAKSPVKGLENQLPLGHWHARAGVLNLEHQHLV